MYFDIFSIQYSKILLAGCEGPNQTVRMRRLIWAFAVRICPKTRFRMPESIIMKTCLYNLEPHFYVVKRGLTGDNTDCGYSLEPICRGDSNEYPQSMFQAGLWKISEFFSSEKLHFLVIKFLVYLNRRVFVMLREHRETITISTQSTCFLDN